MTTNYRQAGTPMVGALREPTPETFVSNMMWQMFSEEKLDNSVQGWKEITVTPDILGTQGPHIFTLAPLQGLYLKPESIRAYGKMKIIYKKTNGNNYDNELPKLTTDEALPRSKLDDERDEEPIFEKNVLDAQNPGHADSLKYCLMTETVNAQGGKEYKTGTPVKLGRKLYSEKRSKVSVVNAFNHALFKDINVQMGGHSVTQNANLEYAHKAFLAQLMSYKTATQLSNLDTEIWDLDEAHEKDHIQTSAWKRRRDRCCLDKEFDFAMQLPTEIHGIPAALVDNMEYKFAFYRNQPNFCLLGLEPETEGQYEINITEFKLSGRYMIPIPSVHNEIQFKLNTMNSVVDFTRTDLISRQIQAKQTQFEFGNVFPSAQLPDQVFMFLVDSDAKNGALNKDPFYFEHCNMDHVVLQYNGNNIPALPYTPDFENGLIARELRGFFDNVNILYRNESLSLNRERYIKGSTVFAWDLNPDLCGGGHWNHKQLQGNISVQVHFATPRDHNITCCLMGVFRDKLVLTKDRIPIVKSTYDEMELAYKDV